MAELIIRQASEIDVKSMAELDIACFADPWSEETFRTEILENERAFYIVAEIEGLLAGYAGVWAILDEGHITNVAVNSDYRRKGIGQAIVQTLIEVAEESGLTSFTLEVRESNLAAQELYSKLGFKNAGLRKGYYLDNGENAIIMWRTDE